MVLDDVKHLMRNFLTYLASTLCPSISGAREEKRRGEILHITTPLEWERNIYINLTSM
jgi:hypothetical protein